ncbi:MAG TPA: hypothetical protein EYP90_05745, partial [Chromatiaceae bacterium]|nr:hypothetical protein [Chromatiaceae bacterium]
MPRPPGGTDRLPPRRIASRRMAVAKLGGINARSRTSKASRAASKLARRRWRSSLARRHFA